jgi:predicted metal-binding membrane protein
MATEHNPTKPVEASPWLRTTVWLALLLIAAITWTIILRYTLLIDDMEQSMATMSGMGQGMATMSAQPESALIFLPLWITMMIAMMFPAVAPVVSLFAAIGTQRRRSGGKATPTWVFLAGYLAIWTLFGVVVYLLSMAVPALSMMAAGLRADHPLIAGIVLLLAGVYQLSPLKQVCLQHCRSPLGVILHGWREGWRGALRMGIAHGAYCLGCCWGLMLVLFAVGLMNLTWMIILTVVIFAEKVIPYGPLLSRVTAFVLICFGLYTIATPWLTSVG